MILKVSTTTKKGFKILGAPAGKKEAKNTEELKNNPDKRRENQIGIPRLKVNTK